MYERVLGAKDAREERMILSVVRAVEISEACSNTWTLTHSLKLHATPAISYDTSCRGSFGMVMQAKFCRLYRVAGNVFLQLCSS